MPLPYLDSPYDRFIYTVNEFYDGNMSKVSLATKIDNPTLSKIKKKKLNFSQSLMRRFAEGIPYVTFDWIRDGKGGDDVVANIEIEQKKQKEQETKNNSLNIYELQKGNEKLKLEIESLKLEIEKLKKVISMLVE